MKKLIFLFLIFGYGFSQTNCELCVQQNGFYCGDDESNWTQYSPLGCVPNGAGGLYYLNDGWDDCGDGSDEQDAEPTTLADCGQYGEQCDTVFIEIPFIEWIYDTIVEIEYQTIIETEYIFDTIIEFQDIIIPEFIDCDTGLPCGIRLQEFVNESKNTGLMYNLSGKVVNKPEGVYIQNGLIKFKL
tara:strand:+ start:1916 stop:2473 length:558 start_codon:yes stop_codon:yes gene_type:complete